MKRLFYLRPPFFKTKDMDYKEKYEQGLECIQEILSGAGDTIRTSILQKRLQPFFPELKESEDERIRKAIKKALQVRCDGSRIISDEPVTLEEALAWLEKQKREEAKEVVFRPVAGYSIDIAVLQALKKQRESRGNIVLAFNGVYIPVDGKTADEIVAEYHKWLEKQGEQKPDDNVEPKFKVGNWYQCTKDFFGKGVTFDKNTAYYCAKEGCLQNEYGCHIAIVKDLYDNFKLWTIEDANDGDVLMTTKTRNCPFIYRKTNYNNNLAYYYAGVDGNGDFCEGCLKRTMYHFGSVADITPATKEQRDLLFKKMKEASYEWDAEKKELKKIEPKKLDADKVIGWLVANICDFEHYVKLFKKDFGL